MRLLDVCAGIGGFSLAGTWAGHDIAGQIEIDPWCRRVLAKHWPDVPRMNDVHEVRGDEFGPIDILTAGLPCQPFSVAGKRRGASDDRAIWPAVRSVIEVAKPTWIVIENVSGFISMALDDLSADLEAQGYEVGAVVVPAAGVGAYHRRDRVWIVAHAEHVRCDSAEITGSVSARIGAPTGTIPAEQLTGFGGGLRGTADVAAAEYGGLRRGSASGQPRQSAFGGEALADADAIGRDGRADDEGQGSSQRNGYSVSGGREVEPRLGLGPDGLPAGLVRPWDGDWEHGIPRVTAGCPDRVNKLKALGNSIVPQVAYEFLRLMVEP